MSPMGQATYQAEGLQDPDRLPGTTKTYTMPQVTTVGESSRGTRNRHPLWPYTLQSRAVSEQQEPTLWWESKVTESINPFVILMSEM